MKTEGMKEVKEERGNGTDAYALPFRIIHARQALTGNLPFGTGSSRQKWIVILSYERLNSTCARLNLSMD